jgi:hypothetical protein
MRTKEGDEKEGGKQEEGSGCKRREMWRIDE